MMPIKIQLVFTYTFVICIKYYNISHVCLCQFYYNNVKMCLANILIKYTGTGMSNYCGNIKMRVLSTCTWPENIRYSIENKTFLKLEKKCQGVNDHFDCIELL